MKAHFVITISATQKMEKQAEVLIRSIKSLGRCSDSFFTILTHEPEKISNEYISKHEIIGYKQNPNFKYPWTTFARWDITPKADIVIGLDSDVVALRDLNPLLEEISSKKGIFGTIADAFTTSIEVWKKLFDSVSIDYPKKTYVTSKGHPNGPYYINNGVVALSSEYVVELGQTTKKMIEIINSIHYDDYFITQRATTLAVYVCNVPMNVMSKDFNHLESAFGQPNKDTYFFHYNVLGRDEFFNPFNFLSLLL